MYMILTEKFQKTTCMQPPACGWMTGHTDSDSVEQLQNLMQQHRNIKYLQ